MTDRDEHFPALSAEDRRHYAQLADTLIPAAGDMPSATQANVPDEWLDRALRARPDLALDLRDALDAAGGHPPEQALKLLADHHQAAFEALTTITAGGYLMNPRVRSLIGYPGQTERPVTDDIDTYAELLERVIERGPLYRTPPPEK